MIFIPLALVIFALVALVAWQQQQFGLREKEWALERGRLLSRIQHPEYVQPLLMTDLPGSEEVERDLESIASQSDDQSDDIHLVGTVQTFDGSDD